MPVLSREANSRAASSVGGGEPSTAGCARTRSIPTSEALLRRSIGGPPGMVLENLSVFLTMLLLAAAPVPVSLTVSGGVSLGAYEAGYLYYLSETIKLNPERTRLAVATGASAGSINALLAAIEACGEAEPDPTKTLLFR